MAVIPVLKAGTRYMYAFDGDTHPYELEIMRFIDSGQIVNVYEVRDVSRNTNFAIKIARDDAYHDRVRLEYEVLSLLESENKKRGEDQHYAPVNNRLLFMSLSDGTTVPALRMDLFPPDMMNLYDKYRDLRATDPESKLVAEEWAWRAGIQYLKLFSTLLDIGYITSDRKRDTFYWKNGHLFVVDWNVVESVGDRLKAESDHLRLFAGLWFTLFSRLRAEIRPDFYDDNQWGDISLYSRRLIQELQRANFTRVEKAIKDIDNVWQRLKQPLDIKDLQAEWDRRPSDLSPDQVARQYETLLFDVDVARLKDDNQQARTLYDDILNAIRSPVGIADTSGSRSRIYAIAKEVNRTTLDFKAMADELRSIMQSDPMYRHSIDSFINNIARENDPYRHETWDTISKSYKRMLNELKRHDVMETQFQITAQVIDVYRYSFNLRYFLKELTNVEMLEKARENLNRLDQALEQLEQIDKDNRYIVADLTKRIGITDERRQELHRLLDEIISSDPELQRTHKLSEEFVGKAQAGPSALRSLLMGYNRYLSATTDSIRHKFHVEQLRAYADDLIFADEMETLGNHHANLQMVMRLTEIMCAFPLLEDTVRKTKFVRLLEDEYEKVKQYVNADKYSLEYPHYLYKYRRLNHLLQMLYAPAKNR